MSSPRQAITALMVSKLAAIGPQNGDAVVQPIWQVLTKQVPITDIAPEYRPTMILLTEEGESPFIMLGGIKQTTLRIAILLYLNIRTIDEGAEVCDQYTDAVRRCLDVNRDWTGLALVTEITGVPTHQLLTIPDAIATVHAEVLYLHEDRA
jgi:hypothetical protein